MIITCSLLRDVCFFFGTRTKGTVQVVRCFRVWATQRSAIQVARGDTN